MKILIYSNLHPAWGTGGIQVYLGALIKALGELTDGEEEYLLLSARGNEKWLSELCGPNQRVELIPHARAGLGRRAIGRFARAACRLANLLPLFRPDTPKDQLWDSPLHRPPGAYPVPVSTGWIESLGAAAIHFPYQMFVATSLPSVFNPHDLQHLHLPQFFTPSTSVAREVEYPFACRMATRVAVASEWVANDICAHYAVPRRKVTVIPWGAATAAQSEPTDDDVRRVKRICDLPGEYILYPAVAWPHKNHRRLIEAAAILRDQTHAVPLVFTGHQTPLTSDLKRLVGDLGLGGLVRFQGLVPSEDMRAVYRGASAVIVPTLFEAVSGPVAEAWQEKVPVGCSDIPQLREQVGPAALLFDPTSPSAIAQVILQLLRDEPTRLALTKAGTQRLESLQWRSTALKYRELYREVASLTVTSNPKVSWRL